jgi:hypothetical protein
MPIHLKNPRKEELPPLVYFKGGQDEVSRSVPQDFEAAFRMAGLSLRSSELFCTLVKRGVTEINRQRPGTSGRSIVLNAETDRGEVFLNLRVSVGGQVIIRQQPVFHGLIHGGHNFLELKAILTGGFTGLKAPNIIVDTDRRKMGWAGGDKDEPTRGDKYSIDFLKPIRRVSSQAEETIHTPFLGSAKPADILCVNIEIARNLPRDEAEKRMNFYRAELKGWPVHFIKS